MTVGDVAKAVNGKKKYIAGGIGGAISLPFLISFLITMNTTVTATTTQVKNNTKYIDELKPVLQAQVEKTAIIGEKVSGIEKRQTMFHERYRQDRIEYKQDQREQRALSEKILERLPK